MYLGHWTITSGMIWFVGRSLSEYRDYFDENGIKYGVFTDIHRNISKSDKNLPSIPVDFTTEQSILSSLSKSIKNIDGVIAVYETYIYGLSVIAEFYSIPAIPKDVALLCTDKIQMRQSFQNYDTSITPEFREVSSIDELQEFMSTHDYPVILKPASLSKSLLVTKNANFEELKQNFTTASKLISDIYQKQSIKRKPKILIEEFMEGSVHSVDAFVDSVGNSNIIDEIVDYETGYDIGKSENYHFSRKIPSILNKSQKSSIIEVANKGIKALRLKSTPAHIEIIMTNEGPKLVEIGARVGGYRFRMYGYANGIDMIANAVNIVMNKPINITPKFHKNCFVMELFPDVEGRFIGIENEKQLIKLQTLIRYRVIPEIGQKIGLSSSGNKASAIITLGSDNKNDIEKDYLFIKNRVNVLTEY